MDIEQIKESGQIESYIFDWMNNEERVAFEVLLQANDTLATHIQQLYEALGLYAALHTRTPAETLKSSVLSQLKNTWAENFPLETVLPLLTRNANVKFWKSITDGIEHPKFEGVYLHTLRKDETVEISLAWLSDAIPDEHHDDLIESFLILEGSCKCIIGNEEVWLNEGDYIEMPLHVEHNIVATSPQPVKAVLQWLKIAA